MLKFYTEIYYKKLPLKLTYKKYHGLQKTIKKKWQNKIKAHIFLQSRILNKGPNVTINKLLKPPYKLTNQYVYRELVNIKSKIPNLLDTWVVICFHFWKK